MLYQNSSKPLYKQLKDILMENIRLKVYEPGQKIPSERFISEKYKISRPTVRKTINELVNEKVLFTLPGKGTFVAENDEYETPFARLLGFAEEQYLLGKEIKIECVRKGYTIVGEEVMESLRLSGNQVYEIVRTVSIDKELSYIGYNYIPEPLNIIFDSADLTKDIFYHVMELNGYPIEYAEQNIRSVIISDEDAEVLGVKKNQPCLEIERITYSKSKQPLIYTRIVHKPYEYSFNLHLRRQY